MDYGNPLIFMYGLIQRIKHRLDIVHISLSLAFADYALVLWATEITAITGLVLAANSNKKDMVYQQLISELSQIH